MAAGRSPQQRSARRRAAVRLLAAGLGLLGGMTLLGLVWPPSDRAVRDQDTTTAAALGDLPNRPITVLHNGVLVQDHAPVDGPTGSAASNDESAAPGNLMLQDHQCAVAYRNIWYRPL